MFKAKKVIISIYEINYYYSESRKSRHKIIFPHIVIQTVTEPMHFTNLDILGYQKTQAEVPEFLYQVSSLILFLQHIQLIEERLTLQFLQLKPRMRQLGFETQGVSPQFLDRFEVMLHNLLEFSAIFLFLLCDECDSQTV